MSKLKFKENADEIIKGLDEKIVGGISASQARIVAISLELVQTIYDKHISKLPKVYGIKSRSGVLVGCSTYRKPRDRHTAVLDCMKEIEG